MQRYWRVERSRKAARWNSPTEVALAVGRLETGNVATN